MEPDWRDRGSRGGDARPVRHAGAAAGKGVLELVGNDVAAFCDDLVEDSRTCADIYQESVSGEPRTPPR